MQQEAEETRSRSLGAFSFQGSDNDDDVALGSVVSGGLWNNSTSDEQLSDRFVYFWLVPCTAGWVWLALEKWGNTKGRSDSKCCCAAVMMTMTEGRKEGRLNWVASCSVLCSVQQTSEWQNKDPAGWKYSIGISEVFVEQLEQFEREEKVITRISLFNVSA